MVKVEGKKKTSFLKPFTFDLGRKLGPCPQQLNDQAHDSKWFFLRCHCHTQLPCVLSWLRLALLIFQNSKGCTPAPVLHPFFSAKVKAAETTRFSFSLLSAMLTASRWAILHVSECECLPQLTWHSGRAGCGPWRGHTMENKASR